MQTLRLAWVSCLPVPRTLVDLGLEGYGQPLPGNNPAGVCFRLLILLPMPWCGPAPHCLPTLSYVSGRMIIHVGGISCAGLFSCGRQQQMKKIKKPSYCWLQTELLLLLSSECSRKVHLRVPRGRRAWLSAMDWSTPQSTWHPHTLQDSTMQEERWGLHLARALQSSKIHMGQE